MPLLGSDVTVTGRVLDVTFTKRQYTAKIDLLK